MSRPFRQLSKPWALPLLAWLLACAPGSSSAQRLVSVGKLRQVLPPARQDQDSGGAKKSEDSLIRKFSGGQEQDDTEVLPTPPTNRSQPSGPGQGGTVEPRREAPSALGNAEVIRQRYPDGKIQVLRHMVQDREGNYFNHGPWKLFNRNGQVIAEGTFVQGFMEGSWQRWHPASSNSMFSLPPFNEFRQPFLSVAFFNKGKLHGSWVVLDSQRRKVFELGYREGKRHGLATWWYPSGMKMRQMAFREGVLHGDLTQWGPRGRVTRKERYVEGQQIIAKSQNWHTNQKQSETYFLSARLEVEGDDDWWNARPAGYRRVGNEVQHGNTFAWYRNGQPRKRGQYEKGKRSTEFTWWYSNGQKKTSGSYRADEREGQWTWWHENGIKAIQGNYQAGKPVGVWRWWNADGKLLRESDLDSVPEEIESELPDPDQNFDSSPESSILSGIN